MATHHASALRIALAAHAPGRGKLYAPSLKARITEFATSRRREGRSWSEISADLGVHTETLRRWCDAGGASDAMVPVHVVADRDERSAIVVSPSGFRIEGLTLADAVAVLRALG